MNNLLLSVIGLLFGGLCAYLYENTISKITRRRKLVIGGYKLHHSLYGVLLILIAIFNPPSFFLMSAGAGVIVEHYLTGGGLDFITKEKSKR